MSVILVAEQDASYAERIAETLRASGWPAQVVANHESARQIAASARPLLLIANATFAGVEPLLASFSHSRGGPGSVVLVPNAVAAQVSASDYQADDLLAKPFSEDELRAIVKETIARGRPTPAPEPLSRPGRQLTSVDIFGDLLAEVEEEARQARNARQTARAQPTATTPTSPPPVAPMSAPPPVVETPAPRPRRSSQDEIDRKLEETLSGVMPDRLLRATGPPKEKPPKETGETATRDTATGETAPTPERPRSRARSEVPSDNDIDDLLDRTLSSLELPTRPRKTRPAPPPIASPAPTEPPEKPSASRETETTPLRRQEADELFVTEPTAAAPVTEPFITEPSGEPVTEPATGQLPGSTVESELRVGPPDFEPPSFEEFEDSVSPAETPPHLEPPAPMPSLTLSEPQKRQEPAGYEPTTGAWGSGIEFTPPSFEAPTELSPPPSQESTGMTPQDSKPAPAWGFETSMDLFPSSFGDSSGTGSFLPTAPEPAETEPAETEPAETGPTETKTGFDDDDPFASVFEPPGPTSGPKSGPTLSASTPDFTPAPLGSDAFVPGPMEFGTEEDDSAEEKTPFAGGFTELPESPTSFADAWSTISPPEIQPSSFAEPSTDHGAKAALLGVLELRGDDLATRRLPVVAGGPQEDGQRFGDYSLLERVAVGGMAEVWRARRRGVEGFQKTVAIKRILSHLTDTSDFVDMFIDEAKLAAQLSHANITQIYDLGKADGDFFIAMEYVEGKDLRTLFKNLGAAGRSLPLGLGLMVVAAVARALDYAHRKRDFDDQALGLVHRDVSPQNVLISYEGEIKLCDFGIVKAVAKASTTQMGALKGKLQYMSPEQAWGKAVDGRSDIFSLGSVLFEVVTGEKLFTGDSEISVLDAVRECRVTNPRDLVPDLPPSVERIVLKSLAQTPEQRYQTAGEMEHDLQAVLRQLDPAPSQKDLASFLEDLYHPSEQFHSYEPKPEGQKDQGQALPSKPTDSSPSRGKGRWLLAALLLLALAAVAIWLFFGRGSGSATGTSPPSQPAPVAEPSGSPEVPPTGETGGADSTNSPETEAATTPLKENPTPSQADIEALLEKELAAREEKLRSEYEARSKAIEAEIQETQIAEPTDGGGRIPRR